MPCDVWSSLASEAAVDLMNPVGAGGRTVGGGRKAGLDKGGSTQHAAYLGGGREESNRNEIPARRIDMSGAPRLPVSRRTSVLETRDAYSSPQSSAKSAMETAAAMADLCVVARTSACCVAGGLVALEDAGPAVPVAGRGTEGPGSGTTRTPAPLWLGQVCAQGAPSSQRLKGCLVPVERPRHRPVVVQA